MPKTRDIKPDFFRDDKIVFLSFPARLFYIGLWTVADDFGFFEFNPVELKIQLFPADNVDVQSLLQELTDSGRVKTKMIGNTKYGFIPTFSRHQRPDKRYLRSITSSPQREHDVTTSGTHGEHMVNTTGPHSEHDVTTSGPLGMVTTREESPSALEKNSDKKKKKKEPKKKNKNIYIYNNNISSLEKEDIGGVGEKEEKTSLLSEKNKHLDFVSLSDEEYTKLSNLIPALELQKKIEELNDYLGSTGRRYKSHYHTIRNWYRREKGVSFAELEKKEQLASQTEDLRKSITTAQ